MIRAACAGLWLAVMASFAVSASIIGMPASAVAFEVLRATLGIGVVLGIVILARAAIHERRDDDGTGSSA